jgi:multiple sugar transport system substrate-binding protein
MADSHEQELAREMARRGFTRREILKYGLGLGLSASGLSTLLAACGAAVRPQTSEGQAAAGGTAGSAAPAGATASPAPAVGGEAPAAASPASAQYSESEGAGGPWPQSYVPEPSSKVEVAVAHAWDASFWPRQVQFDNLFMKRHPNIVIKAENTPWGEFLKKYLAQAAAGSLPDILYCQFAWAQQFIKQGSFVELDSYIAQQKDFNLEDFTKPSLVSYRANGKLYGIPYDEGPGMLYYNKDIFDKGKVGYPTESWTLDDLKNAAIKLTSGEGPQKIFGFAGTPSPADGAVAPPYLWPFGAEYVSEPNEDKCLVNTQAAIDAFNWWMELRFKHKAVPSPADLQTVQGDPFTFGRVAMMLNGSWATPPLTQNAKFKWDVAIWPKGPKKHSTWSLGSCYAVTKDSKNKDAAWIYLNDYLSSAGQQFMWGITGRGSPARNSAWKSYIDSKFAPPSAALIQKAENSIASHDVLDKPTGPKVSQKAGPIWDLVVNGQMTVPDALNQICKEIDPVLAENRA